MFIYLNSGTACVAERSENQQLMFGHLIGWSRSGLGHWVAWAGTRPDSHLIVSVFLLWFYIPTVYTVLYRYSLTGQSRKYPFILGTQYNSLFIHHRAAPSNTVSINKKEVSSMNYNGSNHSRSLSHILL